MNAMPMEFEWDANKAISNLRKHGVVVILVAHSVRFESGAEVIRIISARKADSKERYRYEHG
jgi:uncharacterized DUF497 family protein